MPNGSLIRPRILAADTDPLTKALLSDLLADHNAEVAFVARTEDLIEELLRTPVDLAILNYGSPEEDGVEVCKRIRELPDLKDMPVLMITARDDRRTRLESLRAGADEFIGKPFDLEEVEARLSMILQAHRYRRMLQERRKLELVAEVAPGGFVIIDSEGTVQFANATAQRWLHVGKPGEAWSFLEHCQAQFICRPEPSWEHIETFLSTESALVLIDGVQQEDAPAEEAFRWISCEIRALDVQQDGGYLVALRDVTKETAERNLLWSLKSTLSHKLRTPCNGLVAPLEMLLQDEDLNEDAHSMLQIAWESAERLRRTVDSMVQFFETHTVAPRRSYNPIDAFAAVLERARQRAGIEVAYQVPEDLNRFMCLLKVEEIETIFAEIFENSRRFHPRGSPCIELSASLNEDSTVSFIVRDDGLNLNTAELQRIVQPFYQSERWHTGEVEGTGLGLNIVSTLMWTAGGNLRLINREDGPGIEVHLHFPVKAFESAPTRKRKEGLNFHI